MTVSPPLQSFCSQASSGVRSVNIINEIVDVSRNGIQLLDEGLRFVDPFYEQFVNFVEEVPHS